MAPKLMPLTEWAKTRYTTPPSLYVLRKLCRDGLFDPPAEKTGRDWYVREDARLVTSDAAGQRAAANDGERAPAPVRRLTLVEQMQRAGL
jgi:hypothetical protein